MKDGVLRYHRTVNQPYQRLVYRLVWRQTGLNDAQGLRVLDVGAGFGVTAAHFGERHDVLALEPDADVRALKAEGRYKMRAGGVDDLGDLPEGGFDAVVCHNVLEYVADQKSAFRGLCRALKSGGTLSLLGHNRPGNVFMAAVFHEDPAGALACLIGEGGKTTPFGRVSYYGRADVEEWAAECDAVIERHYGARAFLALTQNNDIKADEAWQAAMIALESAVEETDPYRSSAFHHHFIIRKK